MIHSKPHQRLLLNRAQLLGGRGNERSRYAIAFRRLRRDQRQIGKAIDHRRYAARASMEFHHRILVK